MTQIPDFVSTLRLLAAGDEVLVIGSAGTHFATRIAPITETSGSHLTALGQRFNRQNDLAMSAYPDAWGIRPHILPLSDTEVPNLLNQNGTHHDSA